MHWIVLMRRRRTAAGTLEVLNEKTKLHILYFVTRERENAARTVTAA